MAMLEREEAAHLKDTYDDTDDINENIAESVFRWV